MTQDQIVQLLQLLEKIATRPYTITGAADWQILVVIGGLLGIVIGLMWTDLKSTIKENKTESRQEISKLKDEWKSEMKEHKEEDEKAIDLLWEAMRNCQSDCCPPRSHHKGIVK